MKPKARTIQQRFGFADTDLKKPKHDEIMLWLDTNINSIVKDWIFKNTDYKGFRINRKIWEYPALDHGYSSTYTIGFIDYCIKIDFLLNEKDERWSATEDRFLFEVKTVIPSLGELIRQIRMYQTYVLTGYWFVVAPDYRYIDTLEAQGIHFIKYEPERYTDDS